MRMITNDTPLAAEGIALLYLATGWCTYCKFTKPAIEAIKPDYPQIDIAMIDGDEDPDAMGRYDAKTYPTLILFKDGVEVARRGSAREPELREWLDANLALDPGLEAQSA